MVLFVLVLMLLFAMAMVPLNGDSVLELVAAVVVCVTVSVVVVVVPTDATCFSGGACVISALSGGANTGTIGFFCTLGGRLWSLFPSPVWSTLLLLPL